MKSLVLETTRSLGAPLGQRAEGVCGRQPGQADEPVTLQGPRVDGLPSCSGQYRDGRHWTSVRPRGSLGGIPHPRLVGKQCVKQQRPQGPGTHACCLSWCLPGALPNPAPPPGQGQGRPPSPGKRPIPTCPSSAPHPPSEAMVAHLDSHRPTQATSHGPHQLGVWIQGTHHTWGSLSRPSASSKGLRGKAQGEGHTREPRPPITLTGTGDPLSPRSQGKARKQGVSCGCSLAIRPSGWRGAQRLHCGPWGLVPTGLTAIYHIWRL